MPDEYFDYEKLKTQTNLLIDELKTSKNQEILKEKISSLWKKIPTDVIQKESDISISNHIYEYGEETTLYMIIYHLFVTGNEDVVETFSNEYHAKNKNYILFCINNFKEFVYYTNKFKNDDYNIQKFVDQLGISNELIFYYNIYRFLCNPNHKESIIELRKNISSIAPKYTNEIKEYLKCLVFHKNLDVKIQKVKSKLEYIFKKEFCKLRDFVDGDFLPLVFKQGCYGFKVLHENNFVLQKFDDLILPVEIPLIDTRQYHSLFVCPVIKEVCLDDNKPVLLECNHVISSSAANILSKYGSLDLFKCPYCPAMTIYEKIIRLNLYE